MLVACSVQGTIVSCTASSFHCILKILRQSSLHYTGGHSSKIMLEGHLFFCPGKIAEVLESFIITYIIPRSRGLIRMLVI